MSGRFGDAPWNFYAEAAPPPTGDRRRSAPPFDIRDGPYPGTVIDFRAAVEARDPDAMAATLADNVVFRSPVAFKPYPGKAITTAILRGVLRVFEDFRYVRELRGEGGRDHALVFQARIGDVAVEGCDFLHVDDSGLIDEFTVMVRPLSAAQALAAAMAAQFEQIEREAAVG
jgi:SnoaL-like protein